MALTALSTLLALAVVTVCALGARAQVPLYTNPETGNVYGPLTGSVTFETAEKSCKGVGGKIASIHSASDNAFVSSICANITSVRTSLDATFGCWLGARRSFNINSCCQNVNGENVVRNISGCNVSAQADLKFPVDI
jgi:hypothetical protein